MTSSRTVLAAACGVAAALAIAVVAASAAGTAVADRQAAMKAMGGDMKAASGAITPYDAAKAKAAMDGLAGTARKLKTLFPADSASDPKTAADPKIWTNTADFNKRLDALAAAATAAGKATDSDSFKAAFKPVGDSCKSCHDVYRMKKKG
jgi:cytochrome c556